MNHFQKEGILNTSIAQLMVGADKVAHVQNDNPLEHALLVLIKSGYSAVPVLDHTYKLKGLISTTMIMDKMLGIESFEMDRLSMYKVEDVMKTDMPKLKLNDPFIKALGLTINHPFICIEDEDGMFQGILTRRSIIKLFTKNIQNHVSQS